MSGRKEKAARRAAGIDLKAERAVVADAKAAREAAQREAWRHKRKRPTIHSTIALAAVLALPPK